MREREEFWKALFERAVHVLGIPNEVTNSKRSEIFSGIPGGKPGYGAVAFILPNFFADSTRVGIGDTKRFHRPAGCGERNKEEASRKNAAGVMFG